MAADYAKTRDTVTQEQLLTIESAINQNMREISLDILRDATHLPPILRLEKLNKYTFNTPNDGGTGAQYRGLINFDPPTCWPPRSRSSSTTPSFSKT